MVYKKDGWLFTQVVLVWSQLPSKRLEDVSDDVRVKYSAHSILCDTGSVSRKIKLNSQNKSALDQTTFLFFL